MNCAECGHPNPDTAKFCNECGAGLGSRVKPSGAGGGTAAGAGGVAVGGNVSLGLSPIEFTRAISATAKGAPYIGEILDRLFGEAHAVVVLLTGDETVRLREAFRDASHPEDGREAVQARPNVLFEAGLALGRKPDHTILVQLGPHRPFSDVGGRHVIRFDGSSAARNEVAAALEAAGCPVNRNGRDWLAAGQRDFDEALGL